MTDPKWPHQVEYRQGPEHAWKLVATYPTMAAAAAVADNLRAQKLEVKVTRLRGDGHGWTEVTEP